MRLAIKTSTYGLIEPVIQMIVFSVHEYVWEKNKIYI